MSRHARRQELIAALGMAGRELSAHTVMFHTAVAERLQLGLTDHKAFDFILRHGPVSAGQLAEITGLTTGAVTGVIDRLERAGYARRVADPSDRRRVKVEVTPEFYARAAEIWAPMAADWRAALARFTRADLERLLEVLRATTEVGRKHVDRLS
jgi:DNA-binding MarR family transcriptional regulator